MVIAKLEDKLIEDIFNHSQQETLTHREYGILRKGCKNNLISEIAKLDINSLIDVSTREDYDTWFDINASEFHSNVYHLYRENLNVEANNPYSYSSKILTRYIKHLTFYSPLFYVDLEKYIIVLHPIISSAFIKAFPNIGIIRLSEIKSKEDYYKIVTFYREIIDDDIKEGDAILDLQIGIDY